MSSYVSLNWLQGYTGFLLQCCLCSSSVLFVKINPRMANLECPINIFNSVVPVLKAGCLKRLVQLVLPEFWGCITSNVRTQAVLGSVVDLLHQPKHFHGHLSLASHLVTQLGVLVHQVDWEGVMVLPSKDVGSTGLPEKGVTSGHPDGMPELDQVQSAALRNQHCLSYRAPLQPAEHVGEDFWDHRSAETPGVLHCAIACVQNRLRLAIAFLVASHPDSHLSFFQSLQTSGYWGF